MRLPLGFSPWDGLGIAFAGAYCVGSCRFGAACTFNGACSHSLELEVFLSLEIEGLLAAFCFPASAFAFAWGFLALFYFSFYFSYWRGKSTHANLCLSNGVVVAKGYSPYSKLFLCPNLERDSRVGGHLSSDISEIFHTISFHSTRVQPSRFT